MRSAVGLLVLLGIAVGAYLPSLGGGFVYDDHRFVEANPAVREGVALTRYFTDPSTQAAGDSHQGLYRPLRTQSFRLVRLLGDGAAPQRIANLLLHLLNGVLVWLLLLRLRPGAREAMRLAGAAVFLLHPLAVECGAWISSRGDLLAVSGMLGALLFHLRRGRAGLPGSLLCFGVALLSKESAAVLPLLLVLVDAARGEVRRSLPRYALHLGVLAAFLAVRYAVLGESRFGQEGGRGLAGGALAESLLGSYYLYARDLLLPLWMSFERRAGAAGELAGRGAVSLLGTVVLAALAWRRHRWVTVSCLWLLVVLLPVTVLQFWFPLKIVAAGRFLYPALAALSLLVCGVPVKGRAAVLVLLLLVTALFPLTFFRARVWHDDRSLWEDVLRQDRDHPMALYGLGVVGLREGDAAGARERLIEARDADPGLGIPTIRYYLGEACSRLADAAPLGSAAKSNFRREALLAYDEAVTAWVGGAREMRHLLRETSLLAAEAAGMLDEPEKAAKYARMVLSIRGDLPRAPWVPDALRRLALHLGDRIADDDLPNALKDLADRLEGER